MLVKEHFQCSRYMCFAAASTAAAAAATAAAAAHLNRSSSNPPKPPAAAAAAGCAAGGGGDGAAGELLGTPASNIVQHSRKEGTASAGSASSRHVHDIFKNTLYRGFFSQAPAQQHRGAVELLLLLLGLLQLLLLQLLLLLLSP
jgi:hypothetical protein